MSLIEAGKKYIKSSEELISMFLGLAIVVVVIVLIFNFFQRKKGSVQIPGATDITLSQNSEKDSGTYEVKRGDNLWKIAENKYNDGFAWTKIAKENNIKNPSLLAVGQKLKMPKIEETTKITTKVTEDKHIDGSEYKVVKGDNLWKISVRAYGDGYQWTKIWQENKSLIRNPNLLEIGMTLKLPNLQL